MPEPKKETKPTMDDLLNQIYEWRERATKELRSHDNYMAARIKAQNLLSE